MNNEIDAVARKVGRDSPRRGEVRTVTLARTFPTGVDDLWDACTDAERIPRWFLPVSGDLRVGGRFQLESNAGGTIERCDPPRFFAASWEFGGSTTWITVRLVPESEERTRLELEHTVPVDEHWDRFGPGAVGLGWDLALVGLGWPIESGTAVDREEAAAWVASEHGVRFMRGSAERWVEADIAGGEDPAEAQARAARTAAAYAGE